MEVRIIDFWMNNCAPCQVMKPILAEFENVEFLNVMENQEMAMKYGIRKAPTIIFLKNGEEVDRFSGIKTKEQIQEILDSII